ncbi:uncharacterized protein [Setaria viridis]|uniref:Uncharacterized protein n=1 Tax=Setaria viridis TaxID=4556 RepID=A0A4U6VGQ4_SETVI|nr:translation initiation factor IF-2-like [Setaria viridis]TKW26539.1 hypothetical protein SEVIR_3G196600v2 [Setaria viridis]
MASAKENVPLAPRTLPRQTSSARPPPPRRPKVVNGATEPAAGGGVLKCACFHLPGRSKNKSLRPPPAMKLSSASRRSAVAPNDVPAAASQSQRVTFRASASLSTWWPASPSAAASAGGATPVPGAASGGVAPRRASASSAPPRNAAGAGAPRASSSSFSHWRRSLSSRVGGRASFSFPTSPASASSSCMSTPKIPQGQGSQQG